MDVQYENGRFFCLEKQEGEKEFRNNESRR